MRWRNWAADAEGITGDELLDFVNNRCSPLKNLQADPVRNPRGFVVRGVFEDAYNYMKSGQLLRQVINKINAIDFNNARTSATCSTTSTKNPQATCKAPATPASSTRPAPSPSSWSTWSNPQLGETCSTRPAAPAASWSAPSNTCASR
jgi:hypothetical protein